LRPRCLDKPGGATHNPQAFFEDPVPLYEYECTKCGHRFERIQKFSDPHVKTCPKCKGKVQRLPSAPAIQFKGSGWYITDYARKGEKESSGSEDKGGKASDEKGAGDKSAADKPGEGKTGKEAKPALKSPPKKGSKD
jgi:putative FmdB family regulatory protein